MNHDENIQDTQVSLPEEPQIVKTPPKKDLIHSAKEFLGNAFGPSKGQDLSTLVEDFTSEMTLVAEGLSEDQTRLSEQADKLSAQQTELEQETLDKLHDVNVSLDELRTRIDALDQRLAKAEKQTADKKIKKVEGFTGLLRQASWLAGILAGAWIITAIINLFK